MKFFLDNFITVSYKKNMPIKLKMGDVLTLVSLKDKGKIVTVQLEAEGHQGFLVFQDGELKEAEFAGLKDGEAMESLLDKEEVVLLDLKEFPASDRIELIKDLLEETFSRVEGYMGVAVVDREGKVRDGGNALLAKDWEKSRNLLRKVQKEEKFKTLRVEDRFLIFSPIAKDLFAVLFFKGEVEEIYEIEALLKEIKKILT